MAKTHATIVINDMEYSVVSDNSPEQLNRIAFTLNEKLRALGSESSDHKSRELLVLTALNVVDDYLRAYDSLKEMQIRLQTLTTALGSAEPKNQRSDTEYENLVAYQEAAEKEMRILREKNHELELENARLTEEIESLQQENAFLSTENEELRHELGHDDITFEEQS